MGIYDNRFYNWLLEREKRELIRESKAIGATAWDESIVDKTSAMRAKVSFCALPVTIALILFMLIKMAFG